METPLISIVVPIYNIEKEIQRCVDSILAQTYTNLEIILVDDGSTDNSGNVIDNIAKKDNRIIVVHKENGGVTRARMEGVKRAAGEWIGFVDGDDDIEPNMYEKLLNNALKNNVDISHCGYQMVFPNRVDYYYNTGKIVEQDNITGLKDLLEGSFVEPGLWNKVYRKKLFIDLLNNDVMDLNIKNNEDVLMNYYLFKKARRSIYLDFCPYHYIVRSTSAANKPLNRNQLYDPINVLKIILKDTEDEEIYSITIKRLLSVYINGASMKNSTRKDFVDEYKKMCKSELKSFECDDIYSKSEKAARFKFRLCSFSPILYRWFHKFYSMANGTYNKYEVKQL